MKQMVFLVFVLLAGCFRFLEGEGGGQAASKESTRSLAPDDIARPAGYHIEPVIAGFTFPTAVVFDDEGGVYVVEAGYAYGEKFTTPRLLKLSGRDTVAEVAAGKAGDGPWTGATFYKGAFYVADGGAPGKILKIRPGGETSVLVDGIPSRGDHHVNSPVIGPDGKLYFGVGTITNSGVVGEDNFHYGWLKRQPKLHDVPCRDVRLRGENFESANPLSGDGKKAVTGAYVPFGTSTEPGQIVQGQIPCSGAVLRVDLEGGTPELVGWGFRNPFGLRFASDGILFVSDNGYDVRGSRPVFGSADWLWRVNPGDQPRWYGWPDYVGGEPIETMGHQPPFGKTPQPLLQEIPNRPPKPVVDFPVHASATGMDFSRSEEFGYPGRLFVAMFGDMAPDAGKVLAPVGFEVVMVDLDRGLTETFLTNKGRERAPASSLGTGGIERPVDVKFDPSGRIMYVVDFGVVRMGDDEGAFSQPKTGVLWKVTRSATRGLAGARP